MSDSDVPIDVGSGPQKIDTSQIDTGSGQVQRQRVILGDNSAAENFVTVNNDGSISASVSGGTIAVNALPPVSGSVSVGGVIDVVQLTSPWVVSGSVSLLNPVASVSVLNPVTNVNANITNSLLAASVTGNTGRTWDLGSTTDSVTTVQGTVPWAASVQGTTTVQQGTSPWVTSTSGSVSILDWPATTAVTQSTVPWAASVTGATGRTWDLNSASDSVTVVQGTVPWAASVTGTVAIVSGASVSILNPSSGSTASSVSVTNGYIVAEQGSPPWSMTGSSVWVLNQSSAAANVNVTNPSLAVTQSTVPWAASVTGTIVADQGAAPWSVSQSGPWAASVQGQLPVTQVGSPWGASVQGTVVSTQGTSPWLVSQSGSPWGASVQGSIGRTWDLSSATDSVTTVQGTVPWAASVTGTTVSTQGTSPWVVSGSVSSIPAGQWNVTDYQGTSPWIVSGSVTAIPHGAQDVIVDNIVAASVQGTIVATEGGVWTVNSQQQGNYGASITNAPLPVTQSGNWGASISNTPIGVYESGNWSASVTGGSVQAIFQDYRPTAASITNYDPSTVASVGQSGTTYYTGAASVPSFVSVNLNGEGDVRCLIGGTWTGTIQFEGSVDNGTTWTAIPLNVVGSGYRASAWTNNGLGFGTVSGLTNIRARALPSSWTGTARITFTFSSEDGMVKINSPISLFDNVQGTQATIAPASSAASVNSTALVTAFSPNTPLPAGTNFIGSASVQGQLPVTQSTAANLNATVVGTGTFAVQSTPAVTGTIYNGQLTVSSTAAALASSQSLTQGVTIEALSTNTVSVFVGTSGVSTSNGLELPPGASITLPVNNLNVPYIRSASGSPVVTYIGV